VVKFGGRWGYFLKRKKREFRREGPVQRGKNEATSSFAHLAALRKTRFISIGKRVKRESSFTEKKVLTKKTNVGGDRKAAQQE